jgi:hypothetical protein
MRAVSFPLRRLKRSVANSTRTPIDQTMADQFSRMVETHEAYERRATVATPPQRKTPAQESTRNDLQVATVPADPAISEAAAPASSTVPQRSPAAGEMNSRLYELKGKIAAIECGKASNGQLAITINSVLMKFHYEDLPGLRVSDTVNAVSGEPPASNSWKVYGPRSLCIPPRIRTTTANRSPFNSFDKRCGLQPPFAELRSSEFPVQGPW